MSPENQGMLVWLLPTLAALFAWGVGQGLVKKFIAEVPPARFCLYFVVAKAFVNLGYFFTHAHPDPFAPEGLQFLMFGVFAYVLDGTAWILYFLSIVAGPITIVGTLSAAFPALTVLLAWIFLGEQLTTTQYIGVAMVISGCIGLSYGPGEEAAQGGGKAIKRYWVLFAGAALLLWGGAQVIVKYAYGLPNANEANMALMNTIGGALSLGVFGLIYGRGGGHSRRDWVRSFVPMGLMALGDLMVIVALSQGPSAMVTPLSGAYPLVTLLFARFVLRETVTKLQWSFIVAILVGMFFCTG